MDLALEVWIRIGSGPIIPVSILVFMDLALEACRVIALGKGQSSFNPCFYGSCSRSFKKQLSLGDGIWVSILVFMDLALEARPSGRAWRRKGVSILVFMDLALEVRWIQSSNEPALAFQSLFLWILLSKIIAQWPCWLSVFCFNPCFYGSCSRRSPHLMVSRSDFLVSILVFMDLALEVQILKCILSLMLVSILVFMDLALEEQGRIPDGSSGQVSILVFMDLALEDHREQNIVIY